MELVGYWDMDFYERRRWMAAYTRAAQAKFQPQSNPQSTHAGGAHTAFDQCYSKGRLDGQSSGPVLPSDDGFCHGNSVRRIYQQPAAQARSVIEDQEFADSFNGVLEQVAEVSRYGPWLAFFKGSKIDMDIQIVHRLVEGYVRRGLEDRTLDREKAAQASEDRYIFLHELVKLTDDPQYIKSELINVLFAGPDTTASLLGNMWFVLAKRPEIWAKLKNEVDQPKGQLPTLEQMKEMKYLKAVINECR